MAEQGSGTPSTGAGAGTVGKLDIASITAKAEAAFEEFEGITNEEEPDDPAETEYELDDEPEGGGDAEPEEDDDPEPDEQVDEDPEPEPEPKKPAKVHLGSKEKPFTVKQLPDQWVELKLGDGQKEVVNLKEIANRGIREEVFNRRMQEVSGSAKQVERIVEKAKAKETQVDQKLQQAQRSLEQLFKNPDDLYDFLDDEYEDVLEQIARKHVARTLHFNKNPGAREQHIRSKYQRKLEAKERADAERREREQTQQRAQENQRRFMEEFEPGLAAGMKEAGYPKFEGEKLAEFREAVMGLLEVRRRQTGKASTREDVRQAVIRAARLVKGETVTQRKPAAAPPPQQRPPRVQQRPQGGKGPTSFKQAFAELERKFR